MKYIAFYDTLEYLHEKRSVAPASANVVAYMAECFADFTDVEIISPSRTLLERGFFRGRTSRVSERITVTQPPTFGASTPITRLLSKLQIQIWLFSYLLFHAKRGEKIVFYHSLSLMYTISLIKLLKGIKPILEIREIYSDINTVRPFIARKEKSFYKCANAFIFPSESLKKVLDIGNRPFVLAPGAYTVHGYAEEKFSDGKIHLIYAGNLRKEKGGAYLAVKCSFFLDDSFTVHILGTGTPKEVMEFEFFLSDALSRNSRRAEIVYEGHKSGEDFYRFLKKCDIGLAIQNDGQYSNTSFPSKILTYLGCGLKVIAPRNDAVTLSPVGNGLIYYDDSSPQIIANVIKSIKQNSQCAKSISLDALDNKLKHDLKFLLEKC